MSCSRLSLPNYLMSSFRRHTIVCSHSPAKNPSNKNGKSLDTCLPRHKVSFSNLYEPERDSTISSRCLPPLLPPVKSQVPISFDDFSTFSIKPSRRRQQLLVIIVYFMFARAMALPSSTHDSSQHELEFSLPVRTDDETMNT
jgi:hypothetical protein